MNIEISTSETLLTPAERQFIQRRLQNSLREYEADILQVQLWMVGIVTADENDAQYCLVNVKIADASLVVCDGTHTELETAISHAAERVNWELARTLGRPQKRHLEHSGTNPDSYRAAKQVEYAHNNH